MGYGFIMSCAWLRSTQYIITYYYVSAPHLVFYPSVVIFLKVIKIKKVDNHTW